MAGSKLSKLLLCGSLLLACSSLTTSQINLQPATVEIRVDSNGICPVSDNTREELNYEVEDIVNNKIVTQLYGLYKHFPANTCADIYQGYKSGFYWLNVSHEPQQLYCSVNENRCCNETDGNWMRIAYLNISNPSTQCPEGWRELESPIRTCRRQVNTPVNSVDYSSYGIPYSKVCGRIIAYQFGAPEAFQGFSRMNQNTIDLAYVDGISITYGQSPRKHIWTFAAGGGTNLLCPCSDNTIVVPTFVNDDYFCERGTNRNGNQGFIDNNPLWDGDGCTGSSTCCDFNNPPWFCKQLAEPITEDIEIRIISYASSQFFLENEDTPVQLIEIYVQ